MLLSRIVGTLAIVGVLAGASCAPAATSTPSPISTKPGPTAAPAAKPPAAASSAAKPAESPAAKSGGAAASAAGKDDWKAEWDRDIAAAKQEGKVEVAGPRGDSYRNAAMAFQKAFPDIKLEYTGLQGADFPPKMLAERDGSQFLWDVFLDGTDSPVTLRARGALDPLRPLLVLPEVLDDSKWLGGFEEGWMDTAHQYLFEFFGYLQYGAHVNRDVVPESELSQFEQLLDPRWKGRIASLDPRRAGAASISNSYLYMIKGEEWLRKLYAQNIAIMSDGRPLAEALIRGTHPIAMGVAQSDFQEFKQQGLTASIKPLDPNSEPGSRITGGSGNVVLINKAPHQAAARVFVNWLLSKDGQEAYVQAMGLSSRRLDVKQPPDDVPNPNVNYVNIHKEEFLPQKELAKVIPDELLK